MTPSSQEIGPPGKAGRFSFTDNPSISSSLKFLRKTPWAREKVERLYLRRK